jgi:hypothetical protein
MTHPSHHPSFYGPHIYMKMNTNSRDFQCEKFSAALLISSPLRPDILFSTLSQIPAVNVSM